jgi:hypothetical protein
MSKFKRNAILLAKLQESAGSDASPSASSNAILASNITHNPVNAQFEERNNIMPYMGNSGQVQINCYGTVSFDVELQSSGEAGTAPAFGPLLRACGMGETVTEDTSVAYAPVSSGHEAATIYYYLDGLLFKMIDAKGTFVLNASAGTIPKLSFSFTGLYVAPSDTTLPNDADYSGFLPPLGVNKVNTPTFKLHSTAFKAESLSIDLANNVVYRNLIGSEAVVISDRKPSGSVSIETESKATKDWYTIIREGTLGAIEVVHGTVAGKIVEIDAPKVQVIDPNFGDSNGISMMNMNLSLQPDEGNDELVLTFK